MTENVKFARAQVSPMKPKTEVPLPKTEYKRVSDADKRPKECIACGGEAIIRRGHQFHDLQDLGTPTTKRVLRHEKITWECKHCKTQFMLVHPDVPSDTGYTDDVKAYVFKRVLGKGDAMNRVAGDLRELHNVEVTPQAIGEWVKAERERSEERPGEEPAAPRPVPVLSLDGTFKAARTKKKRRGSRHGKRAFLVAFNPLEGRPVGGILAAVEREGEITIFLAWLKPRLGRNPVYATVDFDDAWEAPLKAVFPGITILICTFHAVQLLTRGLLKEFNRLQREHNASFIKECGAARKWSAQRDNGSKEPPSALADRFCRRWAGFYARILKAGAERGADKFEVARRALLRAMRRWDPAVAAQYEKLLAPKLPKKRFARKGLARFKTEMRKQWRTVLRGARQEREASKKEFAEAKFLLLKKPENLSEWEGRRLKTFLQANPWARVPRETLLRFYALLDDPVGKDTSLDFLDALVGPEFHDWLRSAVATLKAKRENVFNFVKVWQAHPGWRDIRGLKVNPEHVMKKVNAIARAQYSFRSDESARFRLERALNCPVIISETVLSENAGDQVNT